MECTRCRDLSVGLCRRGQDDGIQTIYASYQGADQEPRHEDELSSSEGTYSHPLLFPCLPMPFPARL